MTIRATLAAVAAGLAMPAWAAPADPAPLAAEADSGSEIIITATRRETALSAVPLAISAITGEALERAGANDIRQLNQLSPSLLVSSSASEAGAAAARIRGVGTVGDNPGLESSVATFIDGVYRNRASVALTELGAIDRIEVLRGPQGTLFGRNASAGLISVVTARPRFDFGGQAELSVGNYDARRFVAGLTGPVSRDLAFRLDGVASKRDGFFTDVVSGRDINNRDRYLLRGQLLYAPRDDLSVRLIGDFSNRHEECCVGGYLPQRNLTRAADGSVVTGASTVAALGRALGGIIETGRDNRTVALTPGQSFRGDVRDSGVSAEVTAGLGGATLTSITAYRDWRWLRGQDADFASLDLLTRRSDGSAGQRFKTFTQELRLQGDAFADRLDWLVGGYFASERLTFRDNQAYGADYDRYANCQLFNSVLPAATLPAPTGNCVNSAVLTSAIAGLQAIPAAQRTAAQASQLATLAALNTDPARPGYGSLAALLGLPGYSFTGRGLTDRYAQTSRNMALFTHNVVKLTDRLSATVGLRYTWERKSLDARLTDTNPLCGALAASSYVGAGSACVLTSVAGGALVIDDGRAHERKLTGTAVLSYRPIDPLLTYASFSRGYKAGGFNLDRSPLGSTTGAVTAANALARLAFAPETVDAFELGAKLHTASFDLNIAAFHQRFRNFQLNSYNGISFIVENLNGCSDDLGTGPRDLVAATGACTGSLKAGVISRGLEAEAALRPARDVGMALGMTIARTRYVDDLVGAGGRALATPLFQLPGRPLSNAPAVTLTGSGGWTPAIGDGLRGLIYADFRYQSAIVTGSDLDLEKRQQGFLTVNARIGLTGRDARWGIELWAQNLLNTTYYQVGFDEPLQGSGTIRSTQGFGTTTTQLYGAFLGDPRTWGLTVRTRF
ncbi:TonB-dependent receptor [Sphingomonas naphthae]|uniref:TonB-dependent receptor n=1 Tax=Sphingomonas naphthae TaxID=1813468 RepID=A0ABY7TJD4_9SPHN|nr:TonB-dependent receptor [Sphingomonas naphthae]WCT72434.1 TonB-dependent receptor [Sphingomonas naphthae]